MAKPGSGRSSVPAYASGRPSTPTDAVTELLAGNHRFVVGAPLHPNQDAAHRAALAAAQTPFAVVFGCSDSRLGAEIIFDRGLGDLFVVRTAGHIIGAEVLASIDYAITVLEVPLVVVLGHDSCGAVRATRQVESGEVDPDPGLQPILHGVAPSIRAAREHGITDDDGVTALHIRRTVDQLSRSTVPAIATGRCGVIGMFYRLGEGRVTVIGELP